MHRLARLSPGKMAVCIFLVAFTVRSVLAWRLGLYAEPVNYCELELIGKSLAETGRFADPYKIPTGPTAHGAPFYPYLVSLVFRAVGMGGEARAVLVVLATAVTALGLALLPFLSRRAGLPAAVGGAAGLFSALLPFRAINELVWETPYTICGWIVAVMVTLDWLREPDRKRSLLCGAAWGALFWIAPQLVTCFALILLVSFRLTGWARAARAVPVVGLTAAALILPWIVRGHNELGGWFFVRSNLGLELAISNFPGAGPDYIANCQSNGMDNFCAKRHPFTNAEEAARVRDLGEIAYHKSRLREAVANISADWGAFVWRTLQRIAMFWFVPSGGLPWKDLVLYPMTVLAFAGAWRMVRLAPHMGWIAVCCLAAYPLPYYLINIITRYIQPLSWLVFFLAFFALAGAVSRKGEQTIERSGSR